jgi:hypothetical protein
MELFSEVLKKGESFLTNEQISVIEECMERTVFGLSLPMGQGKCSARDTPHLMFNGSIKMVQDIQVGELLMGDDSSPRKVLSLGRGKDMMYEVIPQKGETYTFNSEHILCLKCSNMGIKNESVAHWFDNQTITEKTKTFKTKEEAYIFLDNLTEESKICEIPIKEYLKLSNTMKGMLKLYKVPVDFLSTEVPFDPYIIGLWIGDGDSNGPGFTNQDSAIIVYLKKKLPEYDMNLQYQNHKNSNYRYYFSDKQTSNKFTRILRQLNLLNNKHIPDIYKINSREVRLQILAGIIDTDGSLSDNSYDFSQVNEKTIDDVIFLARSLGFAAYKTIKKTTWVYKGERKYGTAFRTTISGNTNEIPVKIERKKAQPRKQPKDVLVTSFKVIEKGIDDYYGFEIDGNRRYLLGNFTVTHNTILSIVIGLKKKILDQSKEPLLVIASKSLIPSWEVEIKKFFGSSLIYQIINVDSRNFVLSSETMLVLVTSETAGKFYKENMISEKFVTKEKYNEPGVRFTLIKNVYDSPKIPYLKTAIGGSIIYQKKWSALIIDEGHKYTKISTARCQALGAICSKNRFILSGTLFDEPDFERILGYYVILHWPGFPRDLPEASKFLKSSLYRGTQESIVERPKVELADVKINKHIIQHNLSEEEGQIYISMKKTLTLLRDYCRRSIKKEERKKFSTYILAMITYIRQSVVIPILPIANITLEMSELNEMRSELTVLLMEQFNKLNLQKFLNDEISAKSTRVKKVIEVVQKHNKPTDKIVVFSCFCTSLDILQYYINEDVPIDIYRLQSTLSVSGRGKLIDEYQKSSENSILLGTYELMAEGLNLQCANVVIILDFWWNSAKTQQAISRVVRTGQISKEVDIYFFTSNTGIEKALFAKQHDKLLLLQEIKTGNIKHSVKTLKMEEILRLIDINENYNFLYNSY